MIITRTGARALHLAALITRDGHRSWWARGINAAGRELGHVIEFDHAVRAGWLR